MSGSIGIFGAVFRDLRGKIATRAVPAELASADRLVAHADEADVQLAMLLVSCNQTLAAMDQFLAATFDGLTDEEQMQMLCSDELGVILGARTTITDIATPRKDE